MPPLPPLPASSPPRLRLMLVIFSTMSQIAALDNGKGVTPPMGWRSWNLYGGGVNQTPIENIMKGITSRKRLVDGKPTSLCDLGYCDVGLDDNWQRCGRYGEQGYTYHDGGGNPVVEPAKFPDMIAMTNTAHKLNLTAGWYLNNCICADHCGSGDDHKESTSKCYVGDVAALIQFGFDSVKLDGCGKQRDLDLWESLMNATGKPILIENCHWGQTVPNATWCPWNFYRTSGDVRASFGSILFNLQTTVQWAKKSLSRPGCWAYPDMLEVGCKHGPGGKHDPGLSAEETRSHFGAWSIVSSPLTLSHDVNDDAITDAIWQVITNKEAIAINQAWAGHSGSPFKASTSTVKHTWIEEELRNGERTMEMSSSSNLAGEGVPSPAEVTTTPVTVRTFFDASRGINMVEKAYVSASSQFLYKPLVSNGSTVAVLMMNNQHWAQDLTLTFSEVPNLSCSTCSVRDVWARRDLGAYVVGYTAAAVGPHDSAFLVISSPNWATAATAAAATVATAAMAAVA